MERNFIDENRGRTRSFRDEDYKTRRVFLRSYPLHWSGEHERSEETVSTNSRKARMRTAKKRIRRENERREEESVKKKSNRKAKKKKIEKLIISVFQWGEGKVLIMRKFHHKVTVYVIACIPTGFKLPSPQALSST